MNANVISAVWPALSAALSLVMLKVGARVSMLMLGVLPALPELLAASI